MNQMSLSELIQITEIPLLVKFGAVWCGPCKTIKPLLEELAISWEGDVDLWDIDCDEDPDTAVTWRVRSIPTIILIDTDGTELERLTGSQTKQSIEQMLYKHFEEG